VILRNFARNAQNIIHVRLLHFNVALGTLVRGINQIVAKIAHTGWHMGTIKNFGFMWERDKIDWGRPGPGGSSSSKGVMVGNRKRVVEFADQMGIYVLYDRFEQPVQIGQATQILKRLRDHRRDHLRNRWSLFSWFGFYKVGAKGELLVKDKAAQLRRPQTLEESLNELEAILIQVLEPRLNRRGPNWIDAEEYLQVLPASNDDAEEESDAT
jgi:hypothetical protein